MAEEQLSIEEIVHLAAEDSEFYCRAFFPKTVRQAFADFHHDAWTKLESSSRLVNILMFRGAGKTTHCRLFTSKCIAYGLSRTILYVGKSEGHAIRSTNWIKKQVEHNTKWAMAFGLRQGDKWQDTEFEIVQELSGQKHSIWIMAAGIGGSIRGINRDDYRPDLIVLDDVLDDENAHTPEQRQKVENLVYGALYESLAPASEAPHAKMIGLNTPQHKEDFAVKALRDPQWASAVYGCWTRETANLPIEYQESSWAERFSSEEMRADKRSAFARNMVSTFLREKECKLVSAESASFKLPWLQRYSLPPERMTTVYAIDPVPPPSEAAISKGLHKTDFEAHVVWGALGEKRYLLDYAVMRGHEPTWTTATFFQMQQKWSPIKTLVETIAYQRVLMWILRKAMDAERRWYHIEEYQDRRSKYVRIVTAHNGPASAGRLHVRADQSEFIEQFSQYPDVTNDDILDASAVALSFLEGFSVEEDGTLLTHDEDFQKYRPLQVASAP